MSQEETNTKNDEIRAYELALNIIPTVGDGEVQAVVDDVKKLVEKAGTITNSSAPAMIPLAYVMEKSVNAKKQKYSTAYFAWIKFETEPEKIDSLKASLDSNTNLLRYLVLKADKDSDISAEEVANMLSEEEEIVERSNADSEESGKDVDSVESSEKPKNEDEEIDQAIDDLVKDEKSSE